MSLMTLFIYSGLAATLLPGGSEVLLIAMLLDMPDKAVLLWAVATLGNTLGAYVTLLMGVVAAQKIGLEGWQVAPESCQSVWGKIKNRIKSAFTLSDAQLKQSKKYGMVLLPLFWLLSFRRVLLSRTPTDLGYFVLRKNNILRDQNS